MQGENLILAILRYRRHDIDWEDFDVSFLFAEPFPRTRGRSATWSPAYTGRVS